MPRIRSVKPELFTHPKFVACSMPARLLFIGLLTMADDEGRLFDQPAIIAGQALGGSVSAVECGALLDELENSLVLVRYSVGDRSLIAIHDWNDHQKIDRRRPSRLPAPRAGKRRRPESTQERGDVAEDSSRPRRESIDRSLDQGSLDQGVDLKSAPDLESIGSILGQNGKPAAPARINQDHPDEIGSVAAGIRAKLIEVDPRWSSLSWGQMIRVQRLTANGDRTLMLEAMQRLWESPPANVENPVGLLTKTVQALKASRGVQGDESATAE